MKTLIPLTSALALALYLSGTALAQNGNGNGRDRDDDRGRGSVDRGGGDDDDDRGERGNPRNMRAEMRVPDVVRDIRRVQDGDLNRDLNREARREVERRVGVDGVVGDLRRNAERGLLNGCPPGLAKKDNGCLPPGQVRQIQQANDAYSRYNNLWRTRGDTSNYRYQDGYVYRLSQQGGLMGYLPVLGGVLSQGNTWPGQYAFQQAPQYLSQYFGMNNQYQSRYADGVLYGVNPQTQGIGQIAALLTGQSINVGQRMPDGYDVYNVPYEYRDRYADSAQSQYRYNDGYVYQVDPKTRLVQTVIQLLT